MSKIFNDIPMERAEVLFNNDLDASALKLFYDNCIRMGSGDNLNVTTATIHPVIWFSDFLSLFQEKIRIVSRASGFQLFRIENDSAGAKQIIGTNYICGSITFNSDSELTAFFEEKSSFGSLVVFALCKYLDIVTLKSHWVLRYIDASTKDEIRDRKIDSLI